MKVNPTAILCIATAALLLLSGGEWPEWLTWNVVGAPPFKTDKLAVLVIEESLKHREYSADQLNVILSTDAKSVREAVKARGGEFQTIDLDSADNLQNAPAWVREAVAVNHDSLPWVVGATPASGFSVPLVTESEVLAKIGGLR